MRSSTAQCLMGGMTESCNYHHFCGHLQPIKNNGLIASMIAFFWGFRNSLYTLTVKSATCYLCVFCTQNITMFSANATIVAIS
ncbi:MAG: hypothetical protein IKI06_01145, partial [Prevotella sp.]|nr:hypothetical protein [Prevotella sp.]